MKRDPVAEALHALSEAAGQPHDAATLALVRDSLAHRSNHVVARAARAAREAELSALAPDLILALVARSSGAVSIGGPNAGSRWTWTAPRRKTSEPAASPNESSA